jgi:hypothetical protein
VSELRLLSTTAILGYGFPAESLKAGMERKPHFMGVDAGSTDPGPHYLGSGTSFTSRLAVKRDLRLMLRAAIPAGVPVMVSTCGGAGGEPHLQQVAAIVREIAREDGLSFKLALIHAEQDKALLKRRVQEGRVRPYSKQAPLDEATIDKSERIVGLMGPEPYMEALDAGAQVILAGRSTDPAPWAAAGLRSQMPPAPSWYAGKMLECGAEPALPKKEDCLFATLTEDYIDLEPMSPIRRCTPMSVANFALHENSSPIHHVEPGGTLDTSECRFDALTDRIVRVQGMKWQPADRYTIKLEGVERVGFRAITICGTRDPVLIETIDPYLERVNEIIDEKTAAFGVDRGDFQLAFRCYGRNGVMAEREPIKKSLSHELGFVIEAVAKDQDTANAVIAIARTTMLHSDFPGRLCKEGNMGIPFSPSDIEVGAMYRFNVFHIIEPDSPLEMFPIEYETV